MEKKVLYLPEVASALGRSVKSIRNYIHREDWEAIPKPFLWGGRLCWHPAQLENFISDKAIEAGVLTASDLEVKTSLEPCHEELKRRRPGRPRKVQKH